MQKMLVTCFIKNLGVKDRLILLVSQLMFWHNWRKQNESYENLWGIKESCSQQILFRVKGGRSGQRMRRSIRNKKIELCQILDLKGTGRALISQLFLNKSVWDKMNSLEFYFKGQVSIFEDQSWPNNSSQHF